MANKHKFAGLSSEERLKKLAAMPDEDIDYSDIPDMGNSKNWKKLHPNATKNSAITDQMVFEALSKVMLEDEPHKVPVTIKLDQKIVDFFKKHSKKYQTKINDVLLAFVNAYNHIDYSVSPDFKIVTQQEPKNFLKINTPTELKDLALNSQKTKIFKKMPQARIRTGKTQKDIAKKPRTTASAINRKNNGGGGGN